MEGRRNIGNPESVLQGWICLRIAGENSGPRMDHWSKEKIITEIDLNGKGRGCKRGLQDII